MKFKLSKRFKRFGLYVNGQLVSTGDADSIYKAASKNYDDGYDVDVREVRRSGSDVIEEASDES